MKTLTKSTAMYLACAIDGEGMITINQNSLAMNVANTNLRFARHIHQLYGGRLYPVPMTKDRWTQLYLVQFRKDEILYYLPRILPFLVAKKRRARLLLKFALLKDNWRKHETHKRKIQGFITYSPALKKKLARLVFEIRKENQKGFRPTKLEFIPKV